MNQLKALLKKNVKLTIRQTGTTLFQLITPILCLGFIYFVKKCAQYLLPFTTFDKKVCQYFSCFIEC